MKNNEQIKQTGNLEDNRVIENISNELTSLVDRFHEMENKFSALQISTSPEPALISQEAVNQIAEKVVARLSKKNKEGKVIPLADQIAESESQTLANVREELSKIDDYKKEFSGLKTQLDRFTREKREVEKGMRVLSKLKIIVERANAEGAKVNSLLHNTKYDIKELKIQNKEIQNTYVYQNYPIVLIFLQDGLPYPIYG